MGDERMNTYEDAPTMDMSEFTSLSGQRPRRKFLGVQVPVDHVDPNFHQLHRAASRRGPIALEILGELENDEGAFLFVFYEDNTIRRVSYTPFMVSHRALFDAYLDKKHNKTLLPFDYSGGPPYVHPDSKIRSQIAAMPPSVEPSSDEENGDGYLDEEEEISSSESSEDSSDTYGEEQELNPDVRRSTRFRKPTKVPSLKKLSTAVNTRSTRPRQVPATSGSDIEDSDASDGDSDIIMDEDPPRVQPGRTARQNGTFRAKNPPHEPSPRKPRGPRVPRPINLSYGEIYPVKSVQNGEAVDLFHMHRPTCGVCGMSPAHELMQAYKKKASAKSLDGFARLGGWIQCIRCTEAMHWKCLPSSEQTEVIRAAKLREEQYLAENREDGSPQRKSIDINETTNFLCTSCQRGGVCIGCHRDLESGAPPIESAQITNGEDGSSTAIILPTDGPTELLFRCGVCKRASHYAHLQNPFLEEDALDPHLIEDIAHHYQTEYSWQCDECSSYDAAVDKIIAWRPYPANSPLLSPEQEGKLSIKSPWPREYLVKWAGKGYQRVSWVPHLWLASTSYGKLQHFIRNGSKVRLEHLRSVSANEDGQASGAMDSSTADEELARRRIYEEEDRPTLPNRKAEECIPEAWKTVEQVLDVIFWVPHKQMERERKKAARLRKKKAAHIVSSDEEGGKATKAVEDQMKKFQTLRDRSRQTGLQLLPQAILETPLARKRRNGVLTEEDVHDAVWCYIKWGELDYSEATWDTPPKPGEPGWDEFETAFQRYVQSQSVFVAKVTDRELERRDDRNPADFAKNKMEVSQSFAKDPRFQLRPFQVEGINWLTFQWWRRHPAILADEMGLGKTVQIITFIAKLVEKKIWPHLVVVPNSTILNWMREFQIWAPDVRAVPYYGEAASRQIIRDYEIFHSGQSSGQTKLKLHILVTTYETFLNKSEWSAVFKAPSRWEVLVIDEGQRLKNNNSLLFKQLNQIPVGHRVLMTGTPLNNNLRELFNLMNFIDRENWHDVEALERQYQQDQLTSALVGELHEKLKQYFLRRTKEILNLPQKHEIIVPISLRKLQKGLYKSLIEANLSLLETLLNSNASGTGTKSGKNQIKASRANLRNILMQSRKCVQHPYLIEPSLEPTTDSAKEMHKQLIDASGKLKFLQVMLARLKSRGKRVLLFSQFVIALDIVEDFLVGEGYKFLRLDGDLKGSLRQKDIDKFNAPNSEYFIYLLSTRAGGVGINLATADTVIIFDPDFNPHQDAQAVARAHRFGQKKPVIVFRLMATTGPEGRMMHMGKKKLLLDHVIVQSMEEEEASEDLEGMLLSGAKALFTESEENDVVYTESAIDSLIDNAEKEASKPKEAQESSAMKFEFAQMWETSNPADEEGEGDTDFWAKMIAEAQDEKERLAAEEGENMGRGARRRAAKVAAETYTMLLEDSPTKKVKGKAKQSDDDVDYDIGLDTAAFEPVEPYDAASETDATSGTTHMLIELQNEVNQLRPEERLALEKKEAQKAKRKEQRRLAKARNHEDASLVGQRGRESNAFGDGLPTSFQVKPLPSVLAPVNSNFAMQEPVCLFCNEYHGMRQCPMTKTLEGLRSIRQMILNSDETNEDKEEALERIDEEIARLTEEERLSLMRKQMDVAAQVPAAASSLLPVLVPASHSIISWPITKPAPVAKRLADFKPHTMYQHFQGSSRLMDPPSTQVAKRPSISSKMQRPLYAYGPLLASEGTKIRATSSANGSSSSLQGGAPTSQVHKKRPPDGPVMSEPPAKKVNTGTHPMMCPLCNLPFHPVVHCHLMNADPSMMKRRLDQLSTSTDMGTQLAVNALRNQYNRKMKQADKPPMKYINISD